MIQVFNSRPGRSSKSYFFCPTAKRSNLDLNIVHKQLLLFLPFPIKTNEKGQVDSFPWVSPIKLFWPKLA